MTVFLVKLIGVYGRSASDYNDLAWVTLRVCVYVCSADTWCLSSGVSDRIQIFSPALKGQWNVVLSMVINILHYLDHNSDRHISYHFDGNSHRYSILLWQPQRYILLYLRPRSGELRTQKFKSHLVRTQSLNVLLFKPGVGQYISFLLISTLPVHSPAFFPKPLPIFPCVGCV